MYSSTKDKLYTERAGWGKRKTGYENLHKDQQERKRHQQDQSKAGEEQQQQSQEEGPDFPTLLREQFYPINRRIKEGNMNRDIMYAIFEGNPQWVREFLSKFVDKLCKDKARLTHEYHDFLHWMVQHDPVDYVRRKACRKLELSKRLLLEKLEEDLLSYHATEQKKRDPQKKHEEQQQQQQQQHQHQQAHEHSANAGGGTHDAFHDLDIAVDTDAASSEDVKDTILDVPPEHWKLEYLQRLQQKQEQYERLQEMQDSVLTSQLNIDVSVSQAMRHGAFFLILLHCPDVLQYIVEGGVPLASRFLFLQWYNKRLKVAYEKLVRTKTANLQGTEWHERGNPTPLYAASSVAKAETHKNSSSKRRGGKGKKKQSSSSRSRSKRSKKKTPEQLQKELLDKIRGRKNGSAEGHRWIPEEEDTTRGIRTFYEFVIYARTSYYLEVGNVPSEQDLIDIQREGGTVARIYKQLYQPSGVPFDEQLQRKHQQQQQQRKQ